MFKFCSLEMNYICVNKLWEVHDNKCLGVLRNRPNQKPF